MRRDGQQEVIDFLADPASHGGAPVERISTHAAHLFLAGDRAWKLKRAVRYSYLDFSTIERRRQACEAELRLNRRTAPRFYRAVRSVGRGPDGVLGFDRGEPIDWVVEMERFPADALLIDAARTRRLTDTVAAALADRIAEFQAGVAPVVVPDGAARLAAVIAGNHRSMADLPPGILDPASVDTLFRHSMNALGEHGALLDRRGREGWVRHVHGDLHMGNICLVDGEPLLFDCLEFDPALATIDLLYDVAFLLMDMWHRGFGPAASIVLNRYCDRMGERDGLAALPLMLSIRAAVRAHVEAAGAADGTDGRRSAGAYLEMALRLLDPPSPRLIAVGGLSGSGKSTLARALAALVAPAPGARVLRTDVIRKQCARIPLEARLPASSYSREAARAVYQKLVADAQLLIDAGISVIADGVFADPDERTAIGNAARGRPFLGLWLDAPPSALYGRVAARCRDASDATSDVVDHQLHMDVGALGPWRVVDSSGRPDEPLAAVLALLGEDRK
jgi:aminoglycoside phosphotransferase family enzyme/predicted kinase